MVLTFGFRLQLLELLLLLLSINVNWMEGDYSVVSFQVSPVEESMDYTDFHFIADQPDNGLVRRVHYGSLRLPIIPGPNE